MATPLCVLLLSRPLEGFILEDQARDLLRAPSVVAVEPARLPYGTFARIPEALGDAIAVTQARRLHRRLPGEPRVVVIFHALQYQLARALIARAGTDCELWYSRWDRYEAAYDAPPRMRARIAELHELAAARSSLTFCASVELARQEREAGREAVVTGLAVDSFPSLDPEAGGRADVANLGDLSEPVAVSLGHLGHRVDWALLAGLRERVPASRRLLVGAWHAAEVGADPADRALRADARVEWLGPLDDAAAAAALARADVGLVPFRVEPFNDAGLPYRILKYARMGRRSLCPPLAGVRTWERAVTFCDGVEAMAAALRDAAGARARPDLELRRWALEQAAFRVNAPLWDRLE
ncbi:MAG TPA: hypothetical protein VHB30_14595, partial [Solirubrobacteraceae bacterium]|nr:hypothetical protein [Solirubrobacteraceae bacterium]